VLCGAGSAGGLGPFFLLINHPIDSLSTAPSRAWGTGDVLAVRVTSGERDLEHAPCNCRRNNGGHVWPVGVDHKENERPAGAPPHLRPHRHNDAGRRSSRRTTRFCCRRLLHRPRSNARRSFRSAFRPRAWFRSPRPPGRHACPGGVRRARSPPPWTPRPPAREPRIVCPSSAATPPAAWLHSTATQGDWRRARRSGMVWNSKRSA